MTSELNKLADWLDHHAVTLALYRRIGEHGKCKDGSVMLRKAANEYEALYAVVDAAKDLIRDIHRPDNSRATVGVGVQARLESLLNQLSIIQKRTNENTKP